VAEPSLSDSAVNALNLPCDKCFPTVWLMSDGGRVSHLS
jgi:hypothetical protein